MYQQNQKQTKQKDFSDKVISKIKDACASSKISSNPLDIVVDSIQRIVKNYHMPLEAEQLAQYAKYIEKNFGFLTTNELELAFDLAVSGDLSVDYIPRGLTFTHLQKVLNEYKSKSYPVKFGNKPQHSDITVESQWNTVVKKYHMYHFLADDSSGLYVKIVEWLIETKQISEPEGWEESTWAVKFKVAPIVLKHWLKECYPKVQVIEPTSARMRKPLPGLGEKLKQSIGI